MLRHRRIHWLQLELITVISISFYDTGIREYIGLHIPLTLYEIVGNINNIILNMNALEFPS